MTRRLWLLGVLVATVALVAAPAPALASHPGSDPDPARDSCPREPDQPFHCDGIPDNDHDKYPYDPSNPPPLNPNDPEDPDDPDPAASDPGSGGDGQLPTDGSTTAEGQAPVGGVQTGAGGTADGGPGALALALAGGSLLLAATASGLAVRRRSE